MISESHPKNREVGRGGYVESLPYATPPNSASRPLRTTGVHAVIPHNYTIVDTKTLGASNQARSPGPSQHR